MKTWFCIFFVFLFACSSPEKVKDSAHSISQTDSGKVDMAVEEEATPDEQSVFRAMIDSIYPVIKFRKFDTVGEHAIIENIPLEKHRMLSIILAKKSVNKSDLDRILNLFTCKCKHFSVKKKDSPDLVIEEYVCKNSEDASFWFNQVYNCYIENKNPLGEPLKEPYKLWQSDNRLIHIYTRAQMWITDMDSVNKALMKCFVFSGKTEK